MTIGPILAQTVRHFFPELNAWIDRINDPRLLPLVVYHKRFLLWWGLSLFLFKLGSRRQLDFQLNVDGPQVLPNLNRLAGTRQTTRPVNQTLNYFLGRIGTPAVAGLRPLMLRRLIRMKALDEGRLQGRFVAALDGSGYLVFRERHCEHCLERRCGDTTLYLHQVLEAKLLGPADLVLSLGTEFIDNRDSAGLAVDAGEEQRKQDCELKASHRLVKSMRQEHPQLPLCFTGDSLFGCGEGFAVAQEAKAAFVYVLKPGRLPSVWQDFQALLRLCPPQQRVEWETPAGVRQVYRWVDDLSYTDSKGRSWQFTALQCEETDKDGKQSLWAWVTDLEVTRRSVVEVATKGGRQRWHIENQGFNTQKNSDLNLEHAYSEGEQWAAYYYLLQLAHLILQLVEKGSLLRQLAQQQGKATAVGLYGSLKNMAYRLLESVRNLAWPAAAFRTGQRIQIRFDTS